MPLVDSLSPRTQDSLDNVFCKISNAAMGEGSSEDEERVLNELEKRGLRLNSIWDLVNGPDCPKELIPTLVECLREVRHPSVKEGIVRSLTIRAARGIADDALLHEFRNSDDDLYRWTVGHALRTVLSPKDYRIIIDLVKERRYGSGRQELVDKLGYVNKPEVVTTLLDMLEDDDVMGHAIGALARLKASDALPKVRMLVNHRFPFVRRSAKKFIKKFG